MGRRKMVQEAQDFVYIVVEWPLPIFWETNLGIFELIKLNLNLI